MKKLSIHVGLLLLAAGVFSGTINGAAKTSGHPGHLDRQLVEASSNGDVKAMQELINRGANIDAVDGKGRSVLFHAIQSGNIDAVECLKAVGADFTVTDILSTTALREAAKAKAKRNKKPRPHGSARHHFEKIIELVREESALQRRDKIVEKVHMHLQVPGLDALVVSFLHTKTDYKEARKAIDRSA